MSKNPELKKAEKKPYVKPEIRQIKRVVACGGHKV